MHKILVIDDEPTVTTFIKTGLERTGLYEVVTVNDAAAAYGAARKCRPDLILMDILMPGAQGGEVAARINEDPDLCSVPIVFLTGIIDKRETQARGLSTGGRRVLAKPVTVTELKDSITAALRDAGLD